MAEDLKQYEGQKVIVVVALDKPNEKGEKAVEVEGTAMAANDLGILLKPKGRTQAELIEAGKIEEVRFAPEKITELKTKSLKEVAYGDTRKHLADKHGEKLSELNKVNEADAFAAHKDLDHSDLGHNHDPKDESERAQAIEAAAGE